MPKTVVEVNFKQAHCQKSEINGKNLTDHFARAQIKTENKINK